WDSPSTAAVVRQLARRLDRRGGQILLRSETPDGEWHLQGILLGLVKRGYPARVRGEAGGLYPRDLVIGSGPIQDRLLVLAGADLATLTRPMTANVAAYDGPLPLR